jgi:hypothetical protein
MQSKNMREGLLKITVYHGTSSVLISSIYNNGLKTYPDFTYEKFEIEASMRTGVPVIYFTEDYWAGVMYACSKCFHTKIRKVETQILMRERTKMTKNKVNFKRSDIPYTFEVGGKPILLKLLIDKHDLIEHSDDTTAKEYYTYFDIPRKQIIDVTNIDRSMIYNAYKSMSLNSSLYKLFYFFRFGDVIRCVGDYIKFPEPLLENFFNEVGV